MARYIEVDLIMGKIAKLIEHNKDKKAKEVLFQVGDAVMDCPSADVVPRSEVEALIDERDRYKKYYFRHEYDQWEAEIKQEVAREILLQFSRFRALSQNFAKVYHELEKKYIGENL